MSELILQYHLVLKPDKNITQKIYRPIPLMNTDGHILNNKKIKLANWIQQYITMVTQWSSGAYPKGANYFVILL